MSSARVADVGCGTSRSIRLLEEAGARVVGVDADAGMLGVTRRRVHGTLVRGNAERLPFRTGLFDIALAVTVLESVREPECALAEMARVTRLGGLVVIGTLNPSGPWGLWHRRRLAAEPWSDARFLSRARLLSLGSKIGKAQIRGTLYAPGELRGLAFIGSLLESSGTAFPRWGAFQVMTVEVHR